MYYNIYILVRPRCLDQNPDGSCSDNECFCPCDCNKNQVAFRGIPDKQPATLDHIEYSTSDSFEGSGSSLDAKSLDIKNAQTNDIINQIDLINKNLFKTDKSSTKQTPKIKTDTDDEKCYCHCKCCNKKEPRGLDDTVETTR